MRGKKPKERQRYVLRVNETLVEVTRDVYLAWYQSRRKERYQLEKMQKNGVCGIEKVGETSYNSYLHILSPEEIVIRVSEIPAKGASHPLPFTLPPNTRRQMRSWEIQVSSCC